MQGQVQNKKRTSNGSRGSQLARRGRFDGRWRRRLEQSAASWSSGGCRVLHSGRAERKLVAVHASRHQRCRLGQSSELSNKVHTSTQTIKHTHVCLALHVMHTTTSQSCYVVFQSKWLPLRLRPIVPLPSTNSRVRCARRQRARACESVRERASEGQTTRVRAGCSCATRMFGSVVRFFKIFKL